MNSASGFLISIVAGNGINFGIIFLARFMEARRDEASSVEDAIRLTHTQTWGATATAALAAAVAYASLALTDLPAFRHFGIIGGGGLVLCWAATYTLLPAVVVLIERRWPLAPSAADWRGRIQRGFAGPMFAVARRFPAGMTALACGVMAFASIATIRYVAADPTEYDLRNIRNDASDPSSARALARKVAPIVGPLSRDGRAVVVDRLDQLLPLVAELRRRRAAAPPDAVPFERVVSVLDLLMTRPRASPRQGASSRSSNSPATSGSSVSVKPVL